VIAASRTEAPPAPGVEAMRCIVCASPRAEAFWSADLVQCAHCSLVRAADRFFDCDPRSLYGADYFSGAEYPDYRGERRAARRNGLRRVRVLRQLAPGARTLFEIGCGYGYFLELANALWSSSGIEVSAHAAAEAARLRLRCEYGDYLETPAASPPPDVVCLWDTIEHLVAPRKVLEKVAAEISPGGIVAISTGDIGAWLPRLQRERWRQIHPPTHLWYFSVATLTRLLQETGFRVVRVAHPPLYRSLRLCLRGVADWIPDGLGDRAVPLQTWDLMEIYAQRAPAAAG
jgi:SAM-dependent methyltransferase